MSLTSFGLIPVWRRSWLAETKLLKRDVWLRRHAVFPMGFLLCAPLAGLPESGLPAMRGAVATVLLRLPVIKQMLGALGCFPAGAHVTIARI